MKMLRMLMLAATLGAAAGPATSEDKKAPDATKANPFLAPEAWQGLVKEYWTVEGSTVVGLTTKQQGFNTFLCSKAEYGDFEMKFSVRLKDGKGNSGIQIRSKIADKEKFSVGGPQCDIGEGYWGSLYGELFGGMMKEAPKAEVNKLLKPKDFNEYYIKAVGKHVTIKVNGVVAVDEDFPKMPEKGIVAFQLHAGPPMEVTFKDIAFTDLSK